MKVLITGSTGYLGKYLLRCKPQNVEIIGQTTSLKQTVPHYREAIFDFTREGWENELAKISPDVIVHTAAMAGVDACQQHQRKAYKINVEATEKIALYCKTHDCRLVFISTDQVFSGTRGKYTESEIPHPVNYYGQTKLMAEQKIASSAENWVILRGGLFYGKSLGGRMSFTEFLISQMQEGKKMEVFSDQYRSPVLVDDLAEIVWLTVNAEYKGIFHVAGPEVLSRQQMAEKVCDWMGIDYRLLMPVKTEDKNLKAPRGRDCSLDAAKISSTLNFNFTLFSDGIKRSFGHV